jgi:hypothetical protein
MERTHIKESNLMTSFTYGVIPFYFSADKEEQEQIYSSLKVNNIKPLTNKKKRPDFMNS